ncbi:hypothetical protein G3M48_005238 [Beauveria asiatica]|uniref:LysM domain-containing protein n=1 Tax=Beauveria asiatica TaxID=1069075 RepID=A0AAW0RS44_9HYPO
MADNCNAFRCITKGYTVTWYNSISQEDFAKWNPRIGQGTTTISTTETASTCTQPTGNGFSTPRPNQPGTAYNYVKSHFISKGNTCGQVTWCNGILLQNLAKWNPHAREDRTDP